MAVYTDGIHMIADTVPELHKFARLIELNKCWFENKKNKNHPHYDLGSGIGLIGKSFRNEVYERAINRGAILKTAKELILINKTTQK